MLLHSYVKSYLDIPVVLGVALCQSRVLTYLFLHDPLNSEPEKDALVDKVKSWLFTLDQEGDVIEHAIGNYCLYLYPLDEKYKFLTWVLHDNNVIKSFRAKQLQQKFQGDLDGTIQLFRELSSKRTLSDERVSRTASTGMTLTSTAAENSLIATEATVEEALEALNSLSRFACRYLGTKITSNFWNLAQPQDEWLTKFEIRYSGQITFRGDLHEPIKPLKILVLRKWTQNFMGQCYKLIKDLPEKFEKEGISEQHRKIISIYTSDYLHSEIRDASPESESLFGDLVF